jgi:hypothetical protein
VGIWTGNRGRILLDESGPVALSFKKWGEIWAVCSLSAKEKQREMVCILVGNRVIEGIYIHILVSTNPK